MANFDKFGQILTKFSKILEILCDDLNTPKILVELNALADQAFKAKTDEKKEIKIELLATGSLLGILQAKPDVWLGYGQIQNLNSQTNFPLTDLALPGSPRPA